MWRALIIDDEEAICTLLIYALSRKGIEADIATNGFDALCLFQHQHFDLVITDMQMPGLKGNHVAQEIRNSSRPGTPINGISATAWEFTQSHFDAILEKPFSIHHLLDTVDRLMATSEHVALA
jgi:DNA-binding response OmpR family regulator